MTLTLRAAGTQPAISRLALLYHHIDHQTNQVSPLFILDHVPSPSKSSTSPFQAANTDQPGS